MRLVNNFSTGPNGTAITVANSDDVPGNNAFDTLYIFGAAATLKYVDSVDRPTAQYVAESLTDVGLSYASVGWDNSVGFVETQIWSRCYLKIPTAPSSGGDAALFKTNSDVGGGILVLGVQSSASGQLYVRNSASLVAGSVPVPIGEWFRIEVRAQFSVAGDLNLGNGEARLYVEADAPLEDYTELVSWSGWSDTDGYMNIASWGFQVTAGATTPATAYMSGLELNNTGFPGPAPFKQKGVPGIQPNPIAVHTNTR